MKIYRIPFYTNTHIHVSVCVCICLDSPTSSIHLAFRWYLTCLHTVSTHKKSDRKVDEKHELYKGFILQPTFGNKEGSVGKYPYPTPVPSSHPFSLKSLTLSLSCYHNYSYHYSHFSRGPKQKRFLCLDCVLTKGRTGTVPRIS